MLGYFFTLFSVVLAYKEVLMAYSEHKTYLFVFFVAQIFNFVFWFDVISIIEIFDGGRAIRRMR